MAAASFAAPELLVDDAEAKELAKAINNVAEHYSVTIDPKTLAWLNLLWVVGMMYGTRGVAIVSRKKEERKKAQKPADTMTPQEPTQETGAPFNPVTLP